MCNLTAVDMPEFFSRIENTLLARFRETAVVHHAGDRGVNREELLRDFLRDHLPRRYGVTRGQVITKGGQVSHSADILIYDVLNCSVLFEGETAVLPIEGVYGVIEVKSRLSKAELVDAVGKIEAFKRLAPRDLSIIKTREYVTLHRPSRPFGAVFAFELADNSLASLTENLEAEHKRIHDVNFFTNLVAVLGAGVIHHEKADLRAGQKSALLDTDEFVDLVLTTQKRHEHGEPDLEVVVRLMTEEAGDRTFGRFFVYLLILLADLKLGVPDLGPYLDPDLPLQVFRES